MKSTDVIILQYAREVSKIFHPNNPEYAEVAAKTVFMAAAHESQNFMYRRQRGFARGSNGGAFGIYQTEWPPMLDNLEYLSRTANRPLLERCLDWLADKDGVEEPEESNSATLLLLLVEQYPMLIAAYKEHGPTYMTNVRTKHQEYIITSQGDAYATVLCRTHLMRSPGKIPSSQRGQAEYLKEHYNTVEGAATTEMYLDAYRRWFESANNPAPPVPVDKPDMSADNPFAKPPQAGPEAAKQENGI